jgi:hypothetical protein
MFKIKLTRDEWGMVLQSLLFEIEDGLTPKDRHHALVEIRHEIIDQLSEQASDPIIE